MNSTLIATFPKELSGKIKLLEELKAQLKGLNKNKTKKNEVQRGQLGEYIEELRKKIKEQERSKNRSIALVRVN